MPDLRGGGVERMRIYLAQFFIRNGYDVDIVLLQNRGDLLDRIPVEASLVNLNTLTLKKGFIPLFRYFKKQKPDAVLAAMWPLSIIAILAAKYSGIRARVVVSEHNHLSKTPVFKKKLNKIIAPISMKYAYPKAHAVVGVSKGVIEELKQLSGLPMGNALTIYNPAAPSAGFVKSIRMDNRYWKRRNSKKIIAIGTLKRQKDYPTLIRAFNDVRKATDSELLILGDGNERVNLERLIKDKGLSDYIHMPGFVKNPLAFLKSADLLVLSSAWEGLGNVIIEALACGVPVVSTNCKTGPAEILDNGTYGRLVPVGNHEQLAAAIVESLHTRHDPEALRQRARDFTLGKIGLRYLKLLDPANPYD